MRYPVDYFYIDEGHLLSERVEKALQLIKRIYRERDIPNQQFRHIIFMTKGALTIRAIMAQC